MEKNGGYLSYEDLSEHKSEWVEPVSADYRGYTMWELPPNGQGIAALQILNVLEGFEGDLNSNRHRGLTNGWKTRGLAWGQT